MCVDLPRIETTTERDVPYLGNVGQRAGRLHSQMVPSKIKRDNTGVFTRCTHDGLESDTVVNSNGIMRMFFPAEVIMGQVHLHSSNEEK